MVDSEFSEFVLVVFDFLVVLEAHLIDVDEDPHDGNQDSDAENEESEHNACGG